VPGTHLPGAIKEKILTFGEYSMGAFRIDLILQDGRVVRGVMVAWGEQIVRIGDGEPVDFNGSDVVDAVNCP
jgi:hypothetical protein